MGASPTRVLLFAVLAVFISALYPIISRVGDPSPSTTPLLNSTLEQGQQAVLQTAISSSGTDTMPYAAELRLAVRAVQRAARLTQPIFYRKKQTIVKPDQSPVTVGDFGAQALIIAALRNAFPNDRIIAEETADDLRADAALSSTVWELVQAASNEDAAAVDVLGPAIASEAEMLDILDSGKADGGASGRYWTIDPIDGTKGFIRGDQYAICVALIENGSVVVGVLGCPNLPSSDSVPMEIDLIKGLPEAEKGVLFSAVVGGGAFSEPLDPVNGAAEKKKISTSKVTNLTEAYFCESRESSHSDVSEQAQISQKLGIIRPSVRMDSQAKYGSLARGAGDIYVRLPVLNKKTGSEYPFLIWDHAAGCLIVEEAGGIITDAAGRKLDFGAGRILYRNRGVVASSAGIHGKVLAAVKEVTGDKYQ